MHAARVALDRQVHRRVAVEEVVRHQFEADVLHRHDREVLGLAGVGMPQGVPEHHVGVGDRPVLPHVVMHAVAPVLVDVLAAAVALGNGREGVSGD